MPEVQQEGTFRGSITTFGLFEADSGATAVNITVAIEEVFDGGEWFDWREHGLSVSGGLYVIKKDGTLNERAIESLVKHAGWNKSFESIVDGTWTPNPVQVVVKADTYKNETRYRIAFVNGYDEVPSGGNVTAEKAKAYQQKYGAQLRALGGNVARNAAAPKGAPAKPKPSKQPANTPYSQPEPVAKVAADPDQLNAELGQRPDDVPF